MKDCRIMKKDKFPKSATLRLLSAGLLSVLLGFTSMTAKAVTGSMLIGGTTVSELSGNASGAGWNWNASSATGKEDGTVTPSDDIVISGERIKVLPDGEEGIGVFLLNNDTGTVYPVTRRLTQNDPKKVIARLPALPAGKYTLKIVTRFSHSSVLLNESRTIVYDRLLKVE